MSDLSKNAIKRQKRQLYKLRQKGRSSTLAKFPHKEKNALFSERPTKQLFIHSCSHMTHYSYDLLMDLFSPFRGEIIMCVDWSYSVVLFEGVKDAEMAYEALNEVFVEEVERFLLLEYCLVEFGGEEEREEVPGLYVFKDFISVEEEEEIMRFLDGQPWERLSMRDVQHYGYEYNYETNLVDPELVIGALPEFCDDIIPRIMEKKLFDHAPDQITVNKYLPGCGIPPHVDTHSIFQDGVVSLSLGGNVNIDMRHPDGRHVAVYVPKRALFVMTGESRYLWSHAIAPRKYDFVGNVPMERETRISLSFRSIRLSGECDCDYDVTWQCNTWLNKNNATRREQKYVHGQYDYLSSFPNFQDETYASIEVFVQELTPGSFICDLGCGKGNYHNTQLIWVPIDYCQGFLKQHEETGILAKSMMIPLRPNTIDALLFINVLHHFTTLKHRMESLTEIRRITKNGSIIQIIVPLKNESQKSQEVLIPHPLSPETQIFNHLFTESELDPIFKTLNLSVLSKSVTESTLHYTLQNQKEPSTEIK